MYESKETGPAESLEHTLYEPTKDLVPLAPINPSIIQPKRRDKLYIIGEILDIAKDGALKTQIMYRANLSFTQLNGYLKFVVGVHLLDKISVNNRDIYRINKKGLEFLERYREIQELLKTEDEKKDVRIRPPIY